MSHFFPFFAIIVLELFFFRNMLFNGKLFGDDGDGRLTMLLTEHWWRFFCGKENFSDTLMFFPASGTMGYSDLFFGFGLIHSLFRFVGFDVYISYKFTLMVLHVFGSLSFFYLLNKKLRINLFWSFFALLSFSYSTVFANVGFGHSQLSAISFLPFFVIFLSNIIEKWQSRRHRNLNITFLILTYALILYTAWYIAFFTALFCLVLLVVYLSLLAKNKFSPLNKIKTILFSDIKGDIFIFFIFVLFVFIPFLKIYLPILKNSGGYGYSPEYMPQVADLINVTAENKLFGNIISYSKLSSGESATGFSILVLVFFLLSYYIFNEKNKQLTLRTTFIKSIFISVIVSIILCLKLHSNGASFWLIVYNFIPGGKSIRAVGRFLFFLSFPLSVSIALCGSYFENRLSLWKRIAFGSVILCCLFVFQARKGGCITRWGRSKSLSSLSTVPVPPRSVKAFFIFNDENDSRPIPYKQLDACEIANHFGVPTLNGYSGTNPKDWDGIWAIDSPNYIDAINRWLSINDISNGVYAYDSVKRFWIPIESVVEGNFFEYKFGDKLFFDKMNGATANKHCISGFSGNEDNFTWTDGDEATMKFSMVNSEDLKVTVQYGTFAPPQNVKVYAGKTKIADFVANGDEEKTFDIPASSLKGKTLDLCFKLPDAKSPVELGMSGDARKLALAMKTIIIEADDINN